MKDIIIIGAGPGGMTAALYAARAKLDVVMIDKSMPGGKMARTAVIENWPGIKKVDGVELATNMFNAVSALGVELIIDEVTFVEDGPVKRVKTKNSGVMEAKNIIIATGLTENKLNVPGEEQFLGRGVSYCAICDGALYKDKEVAVVGGGNSALEESLYLATLVKKVHLIHRRDSYRAEYGIVEKVITNPQINQILNSQVVAIKGEQKVEMVEVKDNNSNHIHTIKVDAIFPFVGFSPATAFAAHLPLFDPAGYIVTNESMETVVSGIYAIGDVRAKSIRQIVTASSDGAIAASIIARKNSHL